MQRQRNGRGGGINAGIIALLVGLLAAFFVPLWIVNMVADKGYTGAVVFTNGLKNLGLGDMGRGIGVCGLIGVGAALLVALVVYLLILRLRNGRN